jgi:hypothetical protein
MSIQGLLVAAGMVGVLVSVGVKADDLTNLAGSAATVANTNSGACVPADAKTIVAPQKKANTAENHMLMVLSNPVATAAQKQQAEAAANATKATLAKLKCKVGA